MPTGMISTLTATGVHTTGLASNIGMLGYDEAPLLNLLGYGPENIRKLGAVRDWPNTELKWPKDAWAPKTGSFASGGTTGTLTATTGHGAYLRNGDVVLIDGTEMARVTAVASDTVTITRNINSAGTVNVSSTKTFKIITRQMPEGSNPVFGYTTTVGWDNNYTQILEASVSMTETEMKVKKYPSIEDAFAREVAKLFKNGGSAGDLTIFLANIFYYGIKQQRSTSPTDGLAGGQKVFVTTNVTNLSGATLQVGDIHAIMRAVRDNNGRVTHLVGNSKVMETLNAMWPPTERSRTESAGGATPFRKVDTPHGSVQLVYDWMAPDGELHLINADLCGWLPLREFEMSEIAKQGDRYECQIVGEYTYFCQLEKSHGYIYNIGF